MHKVAKPAATACVLVKVTTARLAKVGDGAEFHFQLTAIEISTVHYVECIGGFFFFREFGVEMSDHVILSCECFVIFRHCSEMCVSNLCVCV